MSDLVSGQIKQVFVMGWILMNFIWDIIIYVVRCGRFGSLVIRMENIDTAATLRSSYQVTRKVPSTPMYTPVCVVVWLIKAIVMVCACCQIKALGEQAAI